MSIDKPEIDFPEGAPPADLEIKDIWEGDGEVAKAGQTVTVHYVGVSFSTGEEFDASWNRGKPLQFQLGAGQVRASTFHAAALRQPSQVVRARAVPADEPQDLVREEAQLVGGHVAGAAAETMIRSLTG